MIGRALFDERVRRTAPRVLEPRKEPATERHLDPESLSSLSSSSSTSSSSSSSYKALCRREEELKRAEKSLSLCLSCSHTLLERSPKRVYEQWRSPRDPDRSDAIFDFQERSPSFDRREESVAAQLFGAQSAPSSSYAIGQGQTSSEVVRRPGGPVSALPRFSTASEDAAARRR